MGKENIDRVLSKLGPKVKRVLRWDDVSRTRYTVGLWILAVSLLAPIVIVLFFEDAVVTAGNKPDIGYYVIVACTWAFIAVFFAGAIIATALQLMRLDPNANVRGAASSIRAMFSHLVE